MYIHWVRFITYGRYILLSVAAIKIKDQWFHAGFAIIVTAGEIALILKYYMIVG